MSAETMVEPLPVFLCYRRDDGSETALWLYHRLHNKRAGDALLDVYFDQSAPAVGDWSLVHLPYLKRSRAMIFISTPGARTRFDGQDWVHMELDWWLEHRELAPITVEPQDFGGRWLPQSIKDKKLDPQRVVVEPGAWSPADAAEHEARVLDQIRKAIRQSHTSFVYQEYEAEKRRNVELQALNASLERKHEELQRAYKALKATQQNLFMALFWVAVFAVGAYFSRQTIHELREKGFRDWMNGDRRTKAERIWESHKTFVPPPAIPLTPKPDLELLPNLPSVPKDGP